MAAYGCRPRQPPQALRPRGGPRAASRNGRAVAASWLPVLDNLERALEHAAADPRLRGRGRPGRARRRSASSPTSASRVATTSAGRSTRPCTRRSAPSTGEGLVPGTVAQVVRPGYGPDDKRPAAGRGRGGHQGSLMARRLLRGARGRPRRRARTRSSGPTASWPASYHPDVNKDPGAEERFKESPRPTTCCPTPSCAAATTRFGEDFRRVPDDVDPAAWRQARTYAGAGAGRARPPVGGGRARRAVSDRRLRRRRRHRGPVRRDVRRPGRRRPGRLGTGPSGRRPGGRAGGDRRGGLPRRPSARFTISGPDGPRTLDVNIPAGVVDGQRIRLRGQGGQGSGGARPATSTSWSGSPTTRATGSRAATCTRLLPSRRGRPRSARRSPSTLPAARPR